MEKKVTISKIEAVDVKIDLRGMYAKLDNGILHLSVSSIVVDPFDKEFINALVNLFGADFTDRTLDEMGHKLLIAQVMEKLRRSAM